MTSMQELNLATTRQRLTTTGNEERVRRLYEAVLANAHSPAMRATNLVAPAPPTSSRASTWRATRPEKNPARINPVRNAARLPAMFVRALIVYSIGMPIFWFAIMDVVQFFEHGESLLGPALDAILMVFGIGLVVVALVAVVSETQKRKRAPSQ